MRVKLVATKLNLGSNGTNPASVSVNDTAADGDSTRETKLMCCFFAESTDFLAGAEILPVLILILATGCS